MTQLKPQYYEDLNRATWATARLDEFLDELPNKVLSDIGSGWGNYRELVQDRGLKWHPYDYVRKIEESEIWDLDDPASKHFPKAGAVFLLEVLEHVPNPLRALKHIADHMTDGGYLFISTPNPFFAKSKLTTLFRNELYAFQPKHLEEHHVFVPLPHVIEMYLRNLGFELQEYAVVGSIGTPRLSPTISGFKNLIRHIAERLLSMTGNRSKGRTQLFLFRKTRLRKES